MKLKIIAIVIILLASMIGVCLPLFSRLMPALRPEKDLFTVVKAFASGVILAIGYMHVLPDSFDDLMSECLPENPRRKFPFTTFVAMLSAVMTLMVDSFAMSIYKKHCAEALVVDASDGARLENGNVLELGIIAHSVVIGLAKGASDNPCTIRSLIAALCFHQMFEGMGLGMHTTGLLNYIALVDLLAAEFMGPKLQTNMKLQAWSYVAVLLGAGFMSLMAKWA
ncbi:hypothetical protein CRYUN_Cryun29cG0086700 [Craigia yunnanensis]